MAEVNWDVDDITDELLPATARATLTISTAGVPRLGDAIHGGPHRCIAIAAVTDLCWLPV